LSVAKASIAVAFKQLIKEKVKQIGFSKIK
jgi:hypothetical protein